MNRSTIGWIVAGLLAFGGAVLAWLFFAGGSGEPSTELTTPTIAAGPSTTGAEPAATTAPAEPVETVAFAIDPEQSLASFELGEELRGTPQQVVGTTSEVAGQVAADPADLSTAQFSPMIVNARTFDTGSSFRDRAIRGPVILNSASDEFEFITFEVTAHDLSGSIAPGETVEFTLTGDLTVRGTTNEAVFAVEVSMVDESTLTGSAETTVARADFGIGIPNAPGVADVSEEVLIRLDFVAVAERS